MATKKPDRHVELLTRIVRDARQALVDMVEKRDHATSRIPELRDNLARAEDELSRYLDSKQSQTE